MIVGKHTRATNALQKSCILTAPIDIYVVRRALKNPGNRIGAGTIPPDALIIKHWLDVAVPFDSSAGLDVTIGDGTDENRFSVGGLNLKAENVLINAAGIDELYGVWTPVNFDFNPTAAADSTVGRATFYLEYLRPDAAHGVS